MFETMETTLGPLPPPSHRDTIYSLKLEPSDDLIELQLSQIPPTRRPRTAGSSHYRPHSIIAAEHGQQQNHYSLSRTRSFYKPKPSAITRPLSIMGFGTKKAPSDSPTIPASSPKIDANHSASSRLFASLRSKKKSLPNFLPISEAGHAVHLASPIGSVLHNNHHHHNHNHYKPTKSHDVPLIQKEDDCTTKSSTERLFWSQKNGQLLLHPFASEGVPYMVAYDGVLIQNDRYTTSLLHRLNTNGSPSFHDYGKKPPGTVLDLGCGDMHWAEQAAIAWKSHKTRVTALDLINSPAMLWDSDHLMPDNMQFVQGDFINDRLPFHNNTFDMVRMACLTLAIPHKKWKPVLTEVLRVLKPGGRVEIIDDQMLFPYGPNPLFDQGFRYSSCSASSSAFSIEEEAYLTQEVLSPQLPTHLPPARSPPAPLSPRRSSSFLEVAPLPDDWEANATLSKDLETIFNAMLVEKYGIHPRPHEFLLETLGETFGKANSKEICSLHLKLASPSEGLKEVDRISLDSSDSGYFSGTNSGKSRINAERDTKGTTQDKIGKVDAHSALKERYSATKQDAALAFHSPHLGSADLSAHVISHRRTSSIDSLQPQPADRISAKAAERLGIDIKTLHAAASAVAERRRSLASLENTQSPGFILYPSTFIPFGPGELEMHTCKHMHTLLGCKSALIDYLEQQVDEHGQKFAEPDELDDALWTYECFRRARFNWPVSLPQVQDPNVTKHPNFTTPGPRSHSRSDLRRSISSWRLAPPHEPTHVRTFRVFEATKSTS